MFMPHVDSQWMPRNLLLPSWNPHDNGVVNLFHLVIFKLHIQRAVTLGIPRKDHHPAGDFVQAMHNPDLFKFLLKRLHQIRRILIPTIGQDRSPRRLVEDEDVSVLKNCFHNSWSEMAAR